MMPLVAGLALGVASSAHCLVMCGPFVAAVGSHFAAPSRGAQLRYALLHHSGRIAMYLLMGLTAGYAGRTVMLGGFGGALAIGAGAILVTAALSSIGGVAGRLSSAGASALGRISIPIFRWGRAHPVAGPVAAGALNGVLPCGMVYAALAAACLQGSAGGAAIVMLGFGLGTAPVLIALSAWSTPISPALRARLRPLAPLVLAIAGVILVARGLTTVRHQAEPARHAAIHLHG